MPQAIAVRMQQHFKARTHSFADAQRRGSCEHALRHENAANRRIPPTLKFQN
jgi:hypothetical protein